MNKKYYEDTIELIRKAKELNLSCVIVFKPEFSDDDQSMNYPDMIISSSTDAAVISALLGNGHDDESVDDNGG